MSKPQIVLDNSVQQYIIVSLKHHTDEEWKLYRADEVINTYTLIKTLTEDEYLDVVENSKTVKYRGELTATVGPRSDRRIRVKPNILISPPSVTNGFFDVDEITDSWLLADGLWSDSLLWNDNENWID